NFASGMSFELQYLSAQEKNRALSQLANWDASKPFGRMTVGLGSELPCFRCYYDADKVLRALLKIAVNLLAALCPTTPVNRDAFQDVIRVILGEVPVLPVMIGQNGFVCASDIEPLKAEGNAHSFRLVHLAGAWQVYFSFFGGRLGAFVQFP